MLFDFWLKYLWVVDKLRYLRTSSWAFFTIFWYFIDQTTKQYIKKIKDGSTENENGSESLELFNIFKDSEEKQTLVLSFDSPAEKKPSSRSMRR